MKLLIKLIPLLFIVNSIFGQKVAIQKIERANDSPFDYLDKAILNNLKNSNLDAKQINIIDLYTDKYPNDDGLYTTSKERMERITSLLPNYKDLGYSFLIIPIQHQKVWEISSNVSLNKFNKIWSCEYYIVNLNDVKANKKIKLTISTSEATNLTLESCSNINNVVSEIKSFVEGSNSTETETSQLPISIVSSKSSKSFSNSSNSDIKYKIVRIKEKNASTNTPTLVEIYDKTLTLKVGDNIVLSRIDQVQIPGERKKYSSVTPLGKAKILEDYNKPLYTAKLIGSTGNNFKNYKDFDENYSAVKGEDSKEIVSIPRVMVIPEKIDQKKLINGEYQLSKEELLIIGALKNKLENKNYTTIGFETAIKKVYEDRQLNENTKTDLKSLILESSGADFYVEFKSIDDINKSKITIVANWFDSNKYTFTKTEEIIEGRSKWVSSGGRFYKELNKNEVPEKYWANLDNVIYLFDQPLNTIFAFHNNGNGKIYNLPLNKNLNYSESGTATNNTISNLNCEQNFNFKIRNYATNEDVATDIKQLNTCGSPEIYKSFAESILSDGALKKINAQFQDILINGKKISVNFTILNSSNASFDKSYNGIRLEEHIQNAVQAYSLNYRQNGVVNKRMTFSDVYIPSINENNGLNNYPNDFALSVIKYLRDVIKVECEKTVIGQNININIQ